MKNIKTLERLQQLHHLIENGCTGSSGDLAQRMGISQRSVYNLLELLKDYNASIGYNKGLKTYYYSQDFQLNVNISVSILSNNETTQVFGGSYF